MNNIKNNQSLVLATRTERLAAMILEVLLFFVSLIFILIILILIQLFNVSDNFIDKFVNLSIYTLFVLYIIISFNLMYYRSQTIGKYLMKIQVYDIKKNKRMAFWRYYLLREFLGRKIIGGIIFIDNLFIFRKDKRTLHDLIAGSQVIKLQDE